MNMFFVFRGDLPTDLYIDRLSRLTGARVDAAFPTRQQAVEHALSIKGVGVVVVERTFRMTDGDDNNLIAECAWNNAHTSPGQELTGSIGIIGPAVVGSTLLLESGDLNLAGPFRYQWLYSADNATWADIPYANEDGYSLTAADVGKYITVRMTKDGVGGELKAVPVGPVVPAQVAS